MIFPYQFILESAKDGNDKEYIGYQLSRYKAIDIDTQEDWDFAEALYSLKMQSNLFPKGI